MSCNAVNLNNVQINYILGLLRSKKYVIYTKPYQLNIVGVRDKNTNPIKFDDKLYVIWKDDKNNWVGKRYGITTDPSTSWLLQGGLGEFNGKKTSAILPSGQYIDTWKLGLHKGQYKALVQAKKICVYRDYDRNEFLTFNIEDKACGYFGVNIHRAKTNGADDGKGTTNKIGLYSAGCQVFENYYCFQEFIKMCEKQAKLYGSDYFTYTLFDKWTQNKLYVKRTIYFSSILVSLGLVGYGLYLKIKKINK